MLRHGSFSAREKNQTLCYICASLENSINSQKKNDNNIMSLNKKLKWWVLSFMILSGAISVFVIVVVITVMRSQSENRKWAEEDLIEHSALCDAVPHVTEQPRVFFRGFEKEEIDRLTFSVLRDGELINDTVIEPYFEEGLLSIPMPYECFLKTDTIVVMTKEPLYFYISGYRHHAHLHYGMFGYVGSSRCVLSEDCVINGVSYYRTILNRANGMRVPYQKD